MGYNDIGQYYAVIAVDSCCGNGFVICWERSVPSSIKEIEHENNWLGETEFKEPSGLYFAELQIDDVEAEWSILDDECNIHADGMIRALNQKFQN